jgi:hypothetical protein
MPGVRAPPRVPVAAGRRAAPPAGPLPRPNHCRKPTPFPVWLLGAGACAAAARGALAIIVGSGGGVSGTEGRGRENGSLAGLAGGAASRRTSTVGSIGSADGVRLA